MNNFLLLSAFLLLLPNAEAFVPVSRAPTTKKDTQLHMGLLSRFRKKKEITVDPIQVGSPLPDIDVQTISEDEIVPISIKEALGDGTSILVGMPGAFTTTCTKTHLPGYVKNAPQLLKLGVNKIVAITTNDKFVNGAWAKEVGLDSEEEEDWPVTILSDGDGELVKELGMVEDMGFGVGVRSKRFALLVKDGVAAHLETDEGMDDCQHSSAENMVKVLTPPKREGGEELEMELDGATMGVLAIGALVVLSSMFSHGDGGSTANTVKAVAPTVETGFQLLQNYR